MGINLFVKLLLKLAFINTGSPWKYKSSNMANDEVLAAVVAIAQKEVRNERSKLTIWFGDTIEDSTVGI